MNEDEDFIVALAKEKFGIVILLWSLRLTLNWALSFKNLTKQDWRYAMFKETNALAFTAEKRPMKKLLPDQS